MYNKKHTEEAKKKMKDAKIGKIGKAPWNKGIKMGVKTPI
jgi:hypothetical protein